MSVTIIAAVGHKGAIGAGGKLPWSIAEDMAHFKATTMGHAVVMGRKTWDSPPAKVRPLPGRFNVVLTRSADATREIESRPGIRAATRLRCALDACAAVHAMGSVDRHVFIIGGAQVYAEALRSGVVDRMLITEVDVDVPEADAFFPRDWIALPSTHRGPLVRVGNHAGPAFREASRRPGSDPRLTFVTWERVSS
jgi:dihydrofolate reductase